MGAACTARAEGNATVRLSRIVSVLKQGGASSRVAFAFLVYSSLFATAIALAINDAMKF
jgi:hypothetical protein